jgi:hypothetical protein
MAQGASRRYAAVSSTVMRAGVIRHCEPPRGSAVQAAARTSRLVGIAGNVGRCRDVAHCSARGVVACPCCKACLQFHKMSWLRSPSCGRKVWRTASTVRDVSYTCGSCLRAKHSPKLRREFCLSGTGVPSSGQEDYGDEKGAFRWVPCAICKPSGIAHHSSTILPSGRWTR